MPQHVIIGGELEPRGMSGVALDAKYIIDRENRGVKQSDINNTVGTLSGGSNFMTIPATSADTSIGAVFTRAGVTPVTNTMYRIGNWKHDGNPQYNVNYYSVYGANGTTVGDLVPVALSEIGIDDNPTPGSTNLVASGGVAGSIVYDISAAHAGAVYEDLATALGTDGINVPEPIRKGGMSVKFIQGTSAQSSENKYVSYRYMSSSTANADFTNVTKWQGVDDEPKGGSKNLIESGGTQNAINTILSIQTGELEKFTPYITGCYIIPTTSASYEYLKNLPENSILLHYCGVRNNNLGSNSIFSIELRPSSSVYTTRYIKEVPDLLKGTIIELPEFWTGSGDLHTADIRVFVEFNKSCDFSTSTGLIGSNKVFVNVLNRTQISLFREILATQSSIVDINEFLSGIDNEPTAGSVKLVKSGGVHKKFSDIITPLSINLFDKTKLTTGYIVESGAIANNQNYKTSDFIRVTPGVGYRCNNNYNFMVCLYDEFGGFVKYYTRSNDFNIAADQIPSGAAYARFTMRNEDVDTALFANGNDYWDRNTWDNEDLLSYSAGIIADKLRGKSKEMVKSIGTFKVFIQTISSIKNTTDYHYTIYLSEGTYTLTPAMIDSLQTETYGRIGILLPDNVDLVGLGKGARIVCDLTGEESGYQQYISPINLKWNNRLKNLTIEITNGRYAVHCDNSNSAHDINWEIEDCTFIHHGNTDAQWNYPWAWGEGSCSGHRAIFKNCKFIAPNGAYYCHNNVGFEKPMYHRFDNCEFISTNKACAVMLLSLNSGTKDVMEFNGCTFNGILDSRKGSAAAQDFNSCDFVVIGSGNSPLCENWYYTDNIPYHSCFGDEVIPFVNNTETAITAGTFMRWNNDELIPMTSEDNTVTFVGVCLDNVAIGGKGYVKVKGTIKVIQPSDVVWATLGTKLKIGSYNSFAVADNINVIGKMYYRNTAFSRYYLLLE